MEKFRSQICPSSRCNVNLEATSGDDDVKAAQSLHPGPDHQVGHPHTAAGEEPVKLVASRVSLFVVSFMRLPGAPPAKLGVHGHQGLAQLGESK